MKTVLRGLVHVYRVAVSPLLGANKCRFYPACSSYAAQALDRHGAAKGAYLAARRILRCHPWGGKDFCDPVPERFDWRDLIGYKRSNSDQEKI